jgi:hypothetical protein
MLALKKRSTFKPILEFEADEATEQIFDDVKRILRVTGINLPISLLARHRELFERVWRAIRPNAETLAFEDAADRVRSAAVQAADAFPRLGVRGNVRLGDSQAFHLQGSLDLYHYVDPKLLLVTSAIRVAFDGGSDGRRGEVDPRVDLIEPGVPAKMLALETVPDDHPDPRIQAVFKDIRSTLGLGWVPCEYRTLALWPNYLQTAWDRMKPVAIGSEVQRAGDQLVELARERARMLPYPILLPRPNGRGDDQVREMISLAGALERALAAQTLSTAMFALEWRPPEVLSRSPFPVMPRTAWGRRDGRPQARAEEGGMS